MSSRLILTVVVHAMLITQLDQVKIIWFDVCLLKMTSKCHQQLLEKPKPMEFNWFSWSEWGTGFVQVMENLESHGI